MTLRCGSSKACGVVAAGRGGHREHRNEDRMGNALISGRPKPGLPSKLLAVVCRLGLKLAIDRRAQFRLKRQLGFEKVDMPFLIGDQFLEQVL